MWWRLIMEWKKLIFIIIFLLLNPQFSFASFFCPTNFSQIDMGATMDQVIQTCGAPDTKEAKEVKKEGPQEWTYYITQTVATTTMTPSQGTLKTQVTFDKSGKLINISVNGIGVGATNICGVNSIQLGDTRETVKKACGDPSFVNKQQNNPPAESDSGTTLPQQKPDQMTTFTYNSTPPVKLIFINGILTDKE